ncbi:MAG: Ig-like domain-containing protein [Lewinellaceae bacterium]|nr:Ig-like domain-containing protein [Lewinellaceae bacterium]
MRLLTIFLLSFILLTAYLSMLSSCAQVGSLTGGPRDTIPPQLDSARSTPNFQTHFEKQSILLAFDEFVDLKDVFNQVVVSPPLAKRPTVTLEKYRNVRFEFDKDEVLRPDATYTIQFGDAIKDFTEGNAAPIRFIFSTGDYIDSLQVSGSVVDAFTGKPVDKILVLLYDNLADSVVRTERPFYFSKTDAKGNFKIENVKSDTFKIFALEDANLNYLFDQSSERIGFLDHTIYTGDSIQAPVQIRFFQEELPLRLLGQPNIQPGLVKLTFNREPWDLEFEASEPLLFHKTEKDTVFLYHERSDTLSWKVLLQTGERHDTVLVRPVTRPANWDQMRLRTATKGQLPAQNPTQPIQVRWNYPVKEVTLDSIQLWGDSTLLADKNLRVYPDSSDLQQLTVQFDWEEGKTYRLLFLPHALEGWQGLTNDSLTLRCPIAQQADLGSLHLKIDSLETGQSYLVELMQQETTLTRFTLSGDQSSWENWIPGLKPGTYQIRLIEDRDGNGRWSPGNYDRKLQPERLLNWPVEPVRANWEVEASFEVKWPEN